MSQVKFFTIVHQVTPNVSSFSEYLKLFPDFHHISVGPNNVITLAISDVCPPRKPLYLFVLSLGDLPSEFIALHLPEIHNKIRRQITISNENYKFDVYSHSIL